MGLEATGDLSAVFAAHLAGPAPAAAAVVDLEAELAARLAAGRAAWPDVALDPPVFVRHLAERNDGHLPALERSGDLYLACACARGDPRAIAALDRAMRPDLARVLTRGGGSRAFVDDVLQAMSERLFVRSGDAPPKIAEYAGRASLRAWLVTVAKRTAMNLGRGKANEPGDALHSGTAIAGAAARTDLVLIKQQLKTELEAAIRAALDALPQRSRTLLLQHLVDGITLPELAARQAVSRATVARWLASARAALRDATRAELLGRLHLIPSEYDSIAALVRSQLELSLIAAVRTDDAT